MDILGIGFAELVFILVIAMMVFGPRRLPEIASKAGKMVRDLRQMSQGLMHEWRREIALTNLDELEKTRQELKQIKNEFTQIGTSVTDETKNVIQTTADTVKSITPPALTTNQSDTNPTEDSALSAIDDIDEATPSAQVAPPSVSYDQAPSDLQLDPGPAQIDPIQLDPSAEPDESDTVPQKPVPVSIPRTPPTIKNGSAEASSQNPNKNPEKTVDEQ